MRFQIVSRRHLLVRCLSWRARDLSGVVSENLVRFRRGSVNQPRPILPYSYTVDARLPSMKYASGINGAAHSPAAECGVRVP
jgi:hypothetical protein